MLPFLCLKAVLEADYPVEHGALPGIVKVGAEVACAHELAAVARLLLGKLGLHQSVDDCQRIGIEPLRKFLLLALRLGQQQIFVKAYLGGLRVLGVEPVYGRSRS